MSHWHHRLLVSLAACLLSAGTVGAADVAPPSEATVAAHVANATSAAGSDLRSLIGLCTPPPPRPSQADSNKGIAALIRQAPPPPGQAFDNLFYVGAKWVSAWAIKTSDGIVLIDALNNATEVKDVLEPALRKVGLDPAQIRTVIVTHGHGDHYGGATYLAERYHARIVMSAIDWTMTETRLDFTTPAWDAPPKRDLAVADGEKVTLGDTVVTLYLTAGHTYGTLSPVFDVRSGGETHRVLLWGGTAFNFGKDYVRLDSYIATTERMQAVAREQNIDVLLSNHSAYDGSLDKLDLLRAQAAPAPNPFVMGTPAVVRALTVMDECARATRDRFKLEP